MASETSQVFRRVRIAYDRHVGWRYSRKSIAKVRFALAPQRKIPIIFCIDVEPDDFFIDRQSPKTWVGYEKTWEFFQETRSEFERISRQPVRYSWFFRMDPQIGETYGAPDWAVKQYRKQIEQCHGRGDHFGIHTHAYRWDEQIGDWIVDHGNQEWIEHCINVAFDTYRKAFGFGCESFRFGDGWMNHPTLCFLESLGVKFDLTLEPGQSGCPTAHPGHPFTGSIPDLHGLPERPYRFSRVDFKVADRRRKTGMWLIPSSVAPLYPPRASWMASLTRSSRRDTCQYRTLNLVFDARCFQNGLDHVLCSHRKPYLALPVRSDGTVKTEQRRNLHRNIAYLLNHPFARRFVFCTPKEALDRLGY